MSLTDSPTAPVTTNTPGQQRQRAWVTASIRRQELSLILVIVLVSAVTGALNPTFLHPSNLQSILQSCVIYFVMACGGTFVIIGGGLDFSVGGTFTLGALVTGLLLAHGWPVPLAILVGLGSGAAVGLINHLIIKVWEVPAIIATLGTFFILSGITDTMTSGNDILSIPAGFQNLAQGSILGVSNMIWFAIVLGLVAWFVLQLTVFGVNSRALGGNRQAAIGNGLRVKRLDAWLYVISGVVGALAGIIYTSQIGAAQVSAGGASVTLDVITAVLIGGVSLQGGLGGIPGVALGAILLSLINNAIVLANIPPDYNNIVIGGILILAVAGDQMRRKRLYKKR